jgi:hypothetical protein
MFNYKLYIQYLLWMKDCEIDNDHKITYDYFIKYTKQLITKEELLDRHTIRNKLFFEWCYLYELL